jgi:O-antigen/teichoic acid export membrane protein
MPFLIQPHPASSARVSMTVEPIQADPLPGRAEAHHAAFFRQSGWLMVATMTAGALMLCIHFLSRKIPASEYGILITLFSVVNIVPTIPFQSVFAQQTAYALATNRQRQLRSTIRAAWLGTVLLWLVAAAVTLCFQKSIVANWHLSNPIALWLLLVVMLFSLLMPLFAGVMQGAQNFLWLGWANIFNGGCRGLAAVLIVFALQGYATGIMTAAFIGLAVATAVGVWQTRSLWHGAGERFEHKKFLRQVVPLMLGFTATQFLFSADTSFVDAYFGADSTAAYGAAGTLSRALLWVVLPLTTVMFPKIVHSTAKSEKMSLLGMVLLGTAGLVALGMLGLWLLGPVAVRIVYPHDYVAPTLAILPWYAGAMVPLTLANVMVTDLMVRSHFRIVPFLVLLAIFYGLALTIYHDSPVMVLKTLCIFTSLCFAICAWFTWGAKGKVIAGNGGEE